MPRHSHFMYELYVRAMFTTFGCLLTLTMLAALAHNSQKNSAGARTFETIEVAQIVPCATFGIIAAVASAIVTNLMLWRHIDVGIVLTCVIHLGIDSLTIALTLAAIPKIATSLGVAEVYAR